MVRKLRHHEQKLLKKTDFLQWTTDNPHEAQVMRRYHIQDREDYSRYNKICGYVTKLANAISLLKPDDPFRAKISEQLLDKLYQTGLIHNTDTLSQLSRVSVSSLCRRRLAVVLVQLKMSETLREAVTYIEQGHVRVGPNTVKNPAFLVSRNMADFVTWVDGSKIRRKIAQYKDEVDDYDLLNA
jgi:U3 small nucleolar ribonucleoprotein protein IMP3